MTVVFDANIWISALEFAGLPSRAIQRALDVEQVAISGFITTEIVRVLTEKFGHDSRWVWNHLNIMLKDALSVEIADEVRGGCRDPSDDAILETAWKANAEYLVTGDKDLLSLKEFRGTKIITPAAYLGIV